MTRDPMDVFPISPASSKPLWFLASICVLLSVVFAVLVYTAYSSQHSRVELNSNQLRLVGDLWARTIPMDVIDVSETRILDLDRQSDYSPTRRTFGTGLPGYASGWFRLRSGEKALVYLTRREQVVYMPTSKGYALLLSVEEPQRFVETLNSR